MSAPLETPHRHVLVAFDGSCAAAMALPLARGVAAQLGAGLTVLYIAETLMPEAEVRQRLNLRAVARGDGHAPQPWTVGQTGGGPQPTLMATG